MLTSSSSLVVASFDSEAVAPLCLVVQHVRDLQFAGRRVNLEGPWRYEAVEDRAERLCKWKIVAKL